MNVMFCTNNTVICVFNPLIRSPLNYYLFSDLFSGINCGINFDKYEEIPVEATGSDVPRPCSGVNVQRIFLAFC